MSCTLRRNRRPKNPASTNSHAELDESTELDIGNPAGLGDDYRRVRQRLTALSILGGCCGTDDRHVAAVCAAMQVSASTPPAPR